MISIKYAHLSNAASHNSTNSGKLTREILAARVMGALRELFTSDNSNLLLPFDLVEQTVPVATACRYGVSWTGKSLRTWQTWIVKTYEKQTESSTDVFVIVG